MRKAVIIALLSIFAFTIQTSPVFAQNMSDPKPNRHHIDFMWLGQQNNDFQAMPIGYHLSLWNLGPISVGLLGASWALNPNVEKSSGLRLLVLPLGLRMHSFNSGTQLYLNGSYSVGRGGDSVLVGMSLSWQNKK